MAETREVPEPDPTGHAADAQPGPDPTGGAAPSGPEPVAWTGLAAVAGAIAAVLVATSGRYGYHRDELYFLRAGRELAFGYVDQPPFTPLVARLATELFGNSLVGLRLISAVTIGLGVLCTGLLAREFGAGRTGQVLAGACVAVAAYTVAVGHLLSTVTFDLLAWTALCLLVVRALRTDGRGWLWVGVVAGIGLQNKVLVAFLLFGLLVGVLLVGPRAPLRNPWLWLAGLVAIALWAPNLIWQATHGWPQLEVSAAIASGGSGTSEPRWLFLPYQFVLVSPALVPVWAVGLWRLARDPELRTYRALAVAYAVLTVLFIATGGKPYYLCGLYPALLAAGAEPTVRWVRRGTGRLRVGLLAAALALSAAVSAFLFLPLVPVAQLAGTPIVAVNYDAGETVGWPAFARTVSRVYTGLPPGERTSTVALTTNYGQAGAIDRYRGEVPLPPAYSRHNSYWEWGPPPESKTTTIAIGYTREQLEKWFGSVELATRVDNGVGLDNDEQGTEIWVCRDRLLPWSKLWPELRAFG